MEKYKVLKEYKTPTACYGKGDIISINRIRCRENKEFVLLHNDDTSLTRNDYLTPETVRNSPDWFERIVEPQPSKAMLELLVASMSMPGNPRTKAAELDKEFVVLEKKKMIQVNRVDLPQDACDRLNIFPPSGFKIQCCITGFKQLVITFIPESI